MDAQLRGHFRGRFAAVEPQLNGLAFEGFVELLSGMLGLDHRFTHTRLVALCLFYLCPSNRRSPRGTLRRQRRWNQRQPARRGRAQCNKMPSFYTLAFLSSQLTSARRCSCFSPFLFLLFQMFIEERFHDPVQLRAGEGMSAAFDDAEFHFGSQGFERFVQEFALLHGHQRIQIAMRDQHGRSIGLRVGDRVCLHHQVSVLLQRASQQFRRPFPQPAESV
jgi:hypothetical protein